jgi:dUTP pyrophosphatase
MTTPTTSSAPDAPDAPDALPFKVKRLDPRVQLPTRSTNLSIGYDVRAFLLSESGVANRLVLGARTTRKVPTGLILLPPPGYCVLVLPRSGWALDSILVANSPGLIDPDYRGELQILLFNGGPESRLITHDMRIAQLILMPYFIPPVEDSLDELDETGRGAAGFGSTGRL